MSVVVGIQLKDRVIMGCDSAAVDTSSLVTRPISGAKMFWNNEFLIGYVGSFRVGQIIQYNMAPPPIQNDNLEGYMIGVFVPALREVLNELGHKPEPNGMSAIQGQVMVGIRGKLFVVHGDYAVLATADGVDAIGCGSDFALGSLYSTSGIKDIKPQDRILEALNAAALFSSGVCPPFVIDQSMTLEAQGKLLKTIEKEIKNADNRKGAGKNKRTNVRRGKKSN